jgi:RecB family exonuclease
VHALAEEMSTGLDLNPDALDARLEAAWEAGSFEALWQLDQHKRGAREALERFQAWQSGRPDRAVLGVEVPFEVDLDAAGTAVRLHGRIDRVERDAAGRLHLIDLKTSRTPTPVHTLADHPQLAAYQAAVRAGALRGLPGAEAPLAGAELVMLRQPDRSGVPRIHSQPAASNPEESDRFAARLGELADRVRAELFAPKPSPDCDRCEFRRCCSGRAEGRGVVE